jgi:pyrroloquinoline quinone (PQQ) biosynthesis protein C
MKTEYVRSLASDSETFARSLEQAPLLQRVISGDADWEEYVRFLSASYHYVRWSGYLLAKTAEGLRRSKRCPQLLAAVDAKAQEEGPHDLWLLRDLRNCGVNVELIKGAPVPKAVEAYVAWSSTFADAGSPAFLGAAYTLEFISMRCATTACRNLRARKTIMNVEHSLRFLEGHGVADHGHIAELEAVLDTVDDVTDRHEIAFSASVMRALYPGFFATQARGGSHAAFDRCA